jgi:hypothetical protein
MTHPTGQFNGRGVGFSHSRGWLCYITDSALLGLKNAPAAVFVPLLCAAGGKVFE